MVIPVTIEQSWCETSNRVHVCTRVRTLKTEVINNNKTNRFNNILLECRVMNNSCAMYSNQIDQFQTCFMKRNAVSSCI